MLCLTRPTDPRWIARALADLPSVLVDHAHCEMKAASNALSLATRFPHDMRIVRALVALAEEELAHYRVVLDELDRRGIALGVPAVDAYAAELRRLAATTAARRPHARRPAVLVDRLLVAAVIEARSCERFRLLADGLASGESAVQGAELAPLYEELFASEAKHFRTLVDLAIVAQRREHALDVAGSEELVRERLAEIARAEGDLVARLSAEPTIHG